MQDVSSISGLLPKTYWIKDVYRGRRNAFGGEATVYKARHGGNDVVIREFHSPSHHAWNDDEGKSVFKVSSREVQAYMFLTHYSLHTSDQLIVREVISHWQLRHPNVVALLGIYQSEDEESGPPSMVLQYAEHASAHLYLSNHSEPQYFLHVVCV